MDNTPHIKVSLAAPAAVLDFLSFLYRVTFINEWQDNKGLLDGFYRVGMFSIAAPVSSWEKLFLAMKRLDPIYFHDRIGLLVFATFLQVRKFDQTFENIQDMPDFVNLNDPVLLKRGLFEIEMANITNVEKSGTSFSIEK